MASGDIGGQIRFLELLGRGFSDCPSRLSPELQSLSLSDVCCFILDMQDYPCHFNVSMLILTLS